MITEHLRLCLTESGYLFCQRFPRRSKVRFAPASFYACGKKDVIRPLPCSSFPTATRCAGLAVGGPPCGRHFSRLMNRGRNLELKDETSRFRPLFLCRKPRIQATFSWLSPFVEMGHPKRKMEKSKCKNENRPNPNPEFSYS